AVSVFSTLPWSRCGFSRSLAAREARNRNRAGEQLALVGPQRNRTYNAIRICGVTGLSSQRLCERAVRNSVSSAASLTAWFTALLPKFESTNDRSCRFYQRAAFGCNLSGSNRFDRGNFRDVVAQHVLDAVFQRHRGRRAA